MKRIFIFANCQGNALVPIFNKIDNFIIDHRHNYLYIKLTGLHNDIKNLLENCDYFIYQPLSNIYPIYNSDNLMKYLKKSCIKISFPYIYCDSFTPLYKSIKRDIAINGEYSLINSNSHVYKNTDVIINLRNKGFSLEKILNMYDNNVIDFNYEERFKNTISILEEKEKNTDINVTKFIKENYKLYKLFNYHINGITDGTTFCNHPSNILVLEYAKQILNIMGYNMIDYDGPELIGTDTLVSRYDIAFYNYEWIKQESPNIDNIIRNLIIEVYNIL